MVRRRRCFVIVAADRTAATEQGALEEHSREQARSDTEERCRGHHGDVAVRNMRQLVTEHALDLIGVEAAHDPDVAHTTACFGLRPVANALGMSVSAIATCGFGMSAAAHSLSTIAWSSGASCGVTMRPCIRRANLVGEPVLENKMTTAMTITKPGEMPDAMSDRHHTDVERADQEHRETSSGPRTVIRKESSSYSSTSSSSWNQPLFGEELFDLGKRGVCGGQHQLGRHDVVVRKRGANLTNLGEQLAQCVVESLRVVGFARRLQRCIERIERVESGGRYVELTLAEDSHDHLISA